jgi:hypothetical protein
MIEDKEHSFKDSLWKSYQSATAVLSDGREFRCLINSNKLSMELDDKMLSIPFKDKCLNSEDKGQQDIGIKCGDAIEWKENGTHWIVYSQYLQEIAYFRGLMRQCENEPLEINGNKFWYYLKGPDEKGIDWQKTKHFIFNDLNYTIEIYISNTTETNEFFHRFKNIKIKGRPFEVQAVDDLSTDGILTVYLKETYTNEWEKVAEEAPTHEVILPADSIRIDGPLEVYPYDIVEYQAMNIKGGSWLLSNNRAKILNSSDIAVKVEIVTGKSGSVSLIYKKDGMDDIVTNIKILSL